MIKSLSGLIILAASFSLLAACNNRDPDQIFMTAGKGGKATVRVIPRFHNRGIDSCIMYVSYNADGPGGNNDVQVCRQNNGEAIGTWPLLRIGHYYFEAQGWDDSSMTVVTGGVGYIVQPDDSSVDVIMNVE